MDDTKETKMTRTKKKKHDWHTYAFTEIAAPLTGCTSVPNNSKLDRVPILSDKVDTKPLT